MIPDQHTRLFGIIGYPLAHTLSPAMHNEAFSVRNMNSVYLAFETRDPAGCIRALRAMNLRGMSVTIPYKTSVIPMLDALDETAEKTGAVNTIVSEGERLVGYNTDGLGALKALEEWTDPRGKTCLILGAGGAARAVGVALREKGVQVSVANRSADRGEALARLLDCPFYPLAEIREIETDLMIQTTPVGMYPHVDHCPVSDEVFRDGMLVMDIVYNPLETVFLKRARQKGCRTVNGLPMLVHQGAEQFRLWTGREPPIEAMYRAAIKGLEQGKTLGDADQEPATATDEERDERT